MRNTTLSSHVTSADLVNIFKLFIPQLLSYPNPTDPLNGEAAALLMRDPDAYAKRIKECVRLHASDPVHLDGTPVVPPPPPATGTPMTPTVSRISSATGLGSGGGTPIARVRIDGAASAVPAAGREAEDDSDKPAESSVEANCSGSGSSPASARSSGARDASGGVDDMVIAGEEHDSGVGVGVSGNKVGGHEEHMKRRKLSSADTNDGAGSSSASEYMMEV